jgi:hypothetical protein
MKLLVEVVEGKNLFESDNIDDIELLPCLEIQNLKTKQKKMSKLSKTSNPKWEQETIEIEFVFHLF